LAGATAYLARLSRRSAVRQLRAYVGVSYQEIKIAEKNELLAFVDYKNAGQTTAHEVVLRMSAKVEIFGITPAWTNPNTAEDDGKGGILLPSVTWRRNCPVVDGIGSDPAALIADLMEQRKRVWVWGTISYVDMFKKKATVKFRFWSSRVRRMDPTDKYLCFALIPEKENTVAVYGKTQWWRFRGAAS
jgi:hypothetical protein